MLYLGRSGTGWMCSALIYIAARKAHYLDTRSISAGNLRTTGRNQLRKKYACTCRLHFNEVDLKDLVFPCAKEQLHTQQL
jgi:hypothetical protein